MQRQEQLFNGAYPNIWIRLPSKPGQRCPYSGFSRALYYQKISEGSIKSAVIRQPGKLTGIRLIWLPSVLAYIEKHVDQEGGAA